jgi:predicted nuclease of restriction endonuclease-like (RecB) superfamily
MKNDRLQRGRKRAGAEFPVAPGKSGLPAEYPALLQEIKTRIQQTRLQIVFAANSALIKLYWEIGRTILRRQGKEGWGAKIVDRLANDLRNAFPDMKGFSPSNLKYMRRFAEECPARTIGQQPADQLPWFHIVLLITRVTSEKDREWYAVQAIHNGWSRNILALQIEGKAHKRHGKAVNNFPLVDDLLRHPEDKPTIGLMLCRSKNKLVVEYALRDLKKPIGVAQWETKITRALPKELKSALPSIKEIEAELSGEAAGGRDA